MGKILQKRTPLPPSPFYRLVENQSERSKTFTRGTIACAQAVASIDLNRWSIDAMVAIL